MFKTIKKYGELELTKKVVNDLCIYPKLCNLFWETTLRCNMNCKHCGSRANENVKCSEELTTDEIKKVFKSVAEKTNARNVMLNITGGEPLLREDLFEVMDYASNKLHFPWGMTTNGLLIDEKVAKKMKDTKMYSISISIDGIEKTHDEFRKTPGAYDRIMEGLNILKSDKFLGVAQTTTVVNKANIDQLEDLYKIMKDDLELDSWRVVNMDPIGRAQDNDNLALDKNDYIRLFEFIKEKRKDKSMDVTYGCSHFLGTKYEGELRRQMFVCGTGILTGSILYNGDIFVCPNVPRKPELIQGNVRKDDFMDVWENKYEPFRNRKEYFFKSECAKCENWDYCRGGASHTWDYDNERQNLCIYNILNKK